MKSIKSRWIVVARATAALMILASAVVAWFWFNRIAPFRHAIDPEWLRSHSPEAQWREIRSGIQRFRWMHDDGRAAGYCGDASFMAWAMKHTRPDEEIADCTAGHRVIGFSRISNQDVGDDAKAWLAWWEENKAKSQAEWIRDGFRAYGVTVGIPPSDADAIPLLRLLGNTSTNESERLPDFIKYNAFRWLRDSDFNPVAFAISNRNESADDPVKTGLLEYLRRERHWPKKDYVGTIRFGDDVDPYADYTLPVMLEPRFKATVYLLIFGLPLVGGGILLLAGRKANAEAM
jgi:hypothetical protein